MGYQGISLRPFWVAILFGLAILSTIFIWFRGLAIVPLVLIFLTMAAMFYGRSQKAGWWELGFGGLLTCLAIFYMWIFVTDLMPREVWSCEKQIVAKLSIPESYKRISVEGIDTETMPEISVLFIRYRYTDKNGSTLIGSEYCNSDRLFENYATIE